MAPNLQKLTMDGAFEEAKALSQDTAPIKLRNAARSLCDAFKLFLDELGSVIYGYDFISSLSTKIRFAFIRQHIKKPNCQNQVTGCFSRPEGSAKAFGIFL